MKTIIKHSFLLLALPICLSIGACNSSKENSLSKIKELENKLYSDTTKVFDKATADDIIKLYIDYANSYPEEKIAPECLFKASEVSMGLMQSANAIKYLEKVIKEYPDYENVPTCLFLQGFIYETQLNNNVMAQKAYSIFIEQYPNHSLTDDAEFSLKNLGKSNDEIIREFEEKLAKEKGEM
ncbi:MAG: tetratricopeptide repeat protein [Bacteroidota bacterium]